MPKSIIHYFEAININRQNRKSRLSRLEPVQRNLHSPSIAKLCQRVSICIFPQPQKTPLNNIKSNQ